MRIAWFAILLLTALGVMMGVAWAEVLPPADAATRIPALEAALTQQAQLAPAFGLLLAEARLSVGDNAGALAAARAVLAANPPWAAQAAWVALQALPPDACAEVDALARRAADGSTVPQASRIARESFLRQTCGETEAVAGLQRTLAIAHSDEPEGKAARPEPPLTVEERFEQAARLEAARAYPEAGAVLDALAAQTGSHQDQARFERARLEVDRVRQDFKGAAEVFAGLAKGEGPLAEPAAHQHARALGRAGDLAAAERAWAGYRARHPQGPHAEESKFFEVFSIYEAGRHAEAAARFGALLAVDGLASDSSWRASAQWYRAFCLFLAGAPEAAEALSQLETQAKPGTTDARRAAYWSARARAIDDPIAGAIALVRLVNADPGDWYALLVQVEFPEVFPAWPGLPTAPEAPSSAQLLAHWPAHDPVGRGRLALVLAHADADLPVFARALFAREVPDLAGGDAVAPMARAVAQHIGAHDRALKSAVRADYRKVVAMTEPAAGPEESALLRAAWPAGFEDETQAAAARRHVPAGWIWAFIRKESAFAPEAVSHAHAVGLMQLLPRTAAALLALPGFDATGIRRVKGAADLFDPATNIELGAAYLAALSARFGGQLPLVAAAYNAGPAAVVGWLPASGTVRLDQFVETIPYRETREYVKRLVEGRVRVERLHLGRSLQESLRGVPVRLDVSVRPGVDF